jgi:hypothetical protein
MFRFFCKPAFSGGEFMFCPNCGSNIDDQAKICPNCGKASSSVGPQPAPPAPAQTGQIPSMSPAQPQQATPQPYAPPPNDKKAVWSMVLGILSWVCCGIFAGIPAVILGHMSHSNIKKSGGVLKGEGMAIAGLVLGYGSVLISFVLFPIIAAIAIPSLLKARITANESAAAATVRTVSTAEATYSITYPQSGFAPDLATLGSGPGGTCVPSATSACIIDATLGCSSNWCVKDGYKYSVMATGSPTPNEFVVTATPVSSSTGRKSYCSTSDSIVRSQNGVVSAPVSVETCQTWIAL